MVLLSYPSAYLAIPSEKPLWPNYGLSRRKPLPNTARRCTERTGGGHGCHLADSKEQAFKDIKEGAGNVVTEYFGRTLGNEVPDVPRDQIVD
ncbi:MAG: hypothetical protein Ct9H300mP11_10250 [Chloroflexota bacterium]|nr:MAG: hypothetical protein Ct9H300mP11_10250 [Chloroflexota bacterium]